MNNKKLKIGVFIDVYYPMVDGVVMVASNYAKRLAKKHDVTLFVPGKHKKYKNKYNFNYNVVYVKSLKIPFTDYSLPLPFFDFYFKKVLKKHNFDIIHIHSPFTLGSEGLKFASKNNILSVMTIHSQYEIDFYKRTKSKFITKLFMNKIIKRTNLSNHLLTVNNGMKDLYINKYNINKDISIIPNATDLTLIDNLNDINNLKKFLNIKDEHILLYVGRIDVVKNIDFIINVCNELKEDNINFKMYLIGSGPSLNKYIKKVNKLKLNNHIIFLGKITNRLELSKYYKLADLFIFPSLYDTNSLVQIEAASQKIPTLFIKDSITSYHVINNHNGFHANNNILDYKNKIIEILNNENLRLEVGINAYNELYKTWDEVTFLLENKYYELLNEKDIEYENN